jgi:hypothetical protein
MDFKIFISYSTQDLEQVNLLRLQLANTPVTMFVAEHSVLPSHELPKEISNAIRDVVLWSENARDSDWVSQEIGRASALQKLILPLILTEGLKLPGFISNLKYIPVYREPDLALAQAREVALLEYNKKAALLKEEEQKSTLFLMGIGALFLWAINQK